MRGPLVANVSRRRSASNIESRVFSSAQTAARPPGLFSGVPGVVAPISPKKSPCQVSSTTDPGMLRWSSVLPTRPYLNGLMPCSASTARPVLSALRTRSDATVQRAVPRSGSAAASSGSHGSNTCSKPHSSSAVSSPIAHSEFPFTWWISISGSSRARRSRISAVNGVPSALFGASTTPPP